jgi:methylmalonyl-CoA/ethylmalonyl-CoA epimerase
MIQRIDHIGIAVVDLESQIAFYREVLGLPFEGCKDIPERGLKIAVFALGGVRIELLQATSPDSTIASFIARRGEGLHHLAFGDDDARGTLARLAASGVKLIDPEPRPGAGGAKVAFLDPGTTFRVLMEICEKTAPGEE